MCKVLFSFTVQPDLTKGLSIINLQTEGVPGGKSRLAHTPAVQRAGLQLPITGVQPKECWLPLAPAGSHKDCAPGNPENVCAGLQHIRVLVNSGAVSPARFESSCFSKAC